MQRVQGLAQAIGASGVEVDASRLIRAVYSSDASNYRVVPQAVAFPRNAEEVAAVAAVAREAGVPLTARGAGTSCAGNAIGPGIVLDLRRHMAGVLSLDPEARTVRVLPGTVLDRLQAAAAPHGLRFGPDPSTHGRCTVGGTIGNNACGAHALTWGRAAENVLGLLVQDGQGQVFSAAPEVERPGLGDFAKRHLATLRTEFGRFARQGSGYALEHLAPERAGDLAKALVGSEGTCAIVLEATLKLVPVPPATALLVAGYANTIEAADAVPALLAHGPLAMEGLDARLAAAGRRRAPALPPGAGLLMVEVGGQATTEARARAGILARDAGTPHWTVFDGAGAAAVWKLREHGAGLAGRSPRGRQAWPGWEDAAVPPENLGAYLRDFGSLMAAHGVDGLVYGHFGDGCVHVRLDWDLEHSGRGLRQFTGEAAALVAAHGGSLSGEHGDGRARSHLLEAMYSPVAIQAMREFKGLFDPFGALNPGVIVDPQAVDDDLRRPAARPRPAVPGGFAWSEVGGDLTRAAHRCTGIGACQGVAQGAPDLGAGFRAALDSAALDSAAAEAPPERAVADLGGGFPCPSFAVSGREVHSTRGRARVLQELARGTSRREALRAKDLLAALDLCLGCKACSSECPATVDMARAKSEALWRYYRRRPRPRAHYSLGWLPRWLRLAAHARWAVDAAMGNRVLKRMGLDLAGLDSRRPIPDLPRRTFHQASGASWGSRAIRPHLPPGASDLSLPAAHRPNGHLALVGDALVAPAATADHPPVVLWADTFSAHLDPDVPTAMAEVLAGAGYAVYLAPARACCGLTWIATGQLGGARARLEESMEVLAPFAIHGIPIVGVEPSCTAVLRSDLLELFPTDPRARCLADAATTLAELLGRTRGWRPPQLKGRAVIVQPH
ncbi:MAG: FAD-binding protein, partial [Bifidobacteriaceae bacterium]|nr:FAD-binding protein [Bifidobacteriaceae bacterium]